MTQSTPLIVSRNHDNYRSIPREQVESSSSSRTSSSRRRILLVVVATCICILLGASLFFPEDEMLVGPLLGPLLDGDGSSGRKKAVKALRHLSEKMEGSVIFPDDSDFGKVSTVWALQQQQDHQPPLAVVQVAHEADVRLALPVLSEIYIKRGVPFRVKSGGHSYGGYSSVSKGIILSLSHLNKYTFDASTGIATVEPAVTVQDLLDGILVPHGYGGVVGECPGVAEGGYILGGGFGFYSRKYGLGVDSLVRVRLALKDGSVVVASPDENRDLFWAMQGAGQNSFGVVTQLEYRLHPSQDMQLVASGVVPLDPSMMVKIGEKDAPGELSFLLEGPVNGDGTTDVLMSWFGPDQASLDKGEDFIQKSVMPLLPSNGDGITVERTSWSDMTREAGNLDGNLVRAWTGFLFEENNTRQVWDSILSSFKSVCIGNPYLLVDIELWGGAIADKESDETAFYYRKALFNVGLILLVPADVKHAHRIFHDTIQKVDKEWRHVSKHLQGVYTNYIVESLDHHEYARAYWGDNLERLQKLKQKYDPDNVFHHPQSVPRP